MSAPGQEHAAPVEVARSATRFEGEVLLAALRAAGIEGRLTSGDAGGSFPVLGAGGFGILVRAADASAATEVLVNGPDDQYNFPQQ